MLPHPGGLGDDLALALRVSPDHPREYPYAFPPRLFARFNPRTLDEVRQLSRHHVDYIAYQSRTAMRQLSRPRRRFKHAKAV